MTPAHVPDLATAWPTRLRDVCQVLRAAGFDLGRVWIVGGAVRDALLGRAVHDLDLTSASRGLEMARLVADRLGGAFFPLDEGRGCGRAVLWEERPGRRGVGGGVDNPAIAEGARLEVDVTDLRAPSLAEDLAERDFAINAMAVPLDALDRLIDPLGGRADLLARQVRAPGPAVLRADGVRGVRGVRLAAQLGFTIEPATRGWIRDAAPGLDEVAAERVGAELWKCFAAPSTAAALAELRDLDLLGRMVPEALQLVGLATGKPGPADVWEHTLAVVGAAERLRELIDGAAPADAHEATVVELLGPRFAAMRARLAATRAVERPTGPLLEVAALFHDLAKPRVRVVEPDGRVRFPGHEEAGAPVAQRRLLALRLAREEADWVAAVVRHHGLPRRLATAQAAQPFGLRELHRFHREVGPTAVEVCLLSLADNRGKPVYADPAAWRRLVLRLGELIGAELERHDEVVAPPPLLGGRDLLALGFAPGPGLGAALAALVEAQAAGEVTDRGEAEALVRRLRVASG